MTTIYIKSDPRKEVQQVQSLGGLNKANRIVKMTGKKEAVENAFMNIAFKANRSDQQREARRAKR